MNTLLKAYSFIIIIGFLTMGCQPTNSAVITKSAEDRTLSAVEKLQLKNIEQLIQERVTENNIPSLSVGLIKYNKILAYQNVGTTERGGEQAVNENTVFQIASLTKTFTGLIAKELMIEEKIDVNASITTYLPTTLSKATIEKLQPITIRDLLQHKSGFPRDAAQANRPWQFLDGPMVGGYSETELLQDLEAMELIHTPGSKMEYSNLGFGTMGYILERVAGIPLPDLYDKYLVDKYGMKHSTIDLAKAKEYGMATPYMKWWRSIETSPWEMGYLRSAGGLCSTVADLSQMMLQQMNAYQNFAINQQQSALVLSEDKTAWGKSGYPYYGYGIMEFNKAIDTTMVHIGHGGDVDGFASAYIFFPKQQVGIVMLTSSGGEWFNHLEWAIQGVLLDIQPRQTMDLAAANFDQFTGTYQFADGQTLTVTQAENHIISQSKEGKPYAAFPYEANKFYYPNYPAELIFENGRVQKVDPMGNSSFGEKMTVSLTVN